MKLLLDTHTFLWFISGNWQLSETARNLIENKNNRQFLSIASLWEMSIKLSIGKLQLAIPFTDLVKNEVNGNSITILNILPEHLDRLAQLPFDHKEHLDRLIIAQSLIGEMSIISKDRLFRNYSENVLCK